MRVCALFGKSVNQATKEASGELKCREQYQSSGPHNAFSYLAKLANKTVVEATLQEHCVELFPERLEEKFASLSGRILHDGYLKQTFVSRRL